ncbi:isochorismatase family protein [Psychrobacillus sp. L3]|uniref:isochorismatase family protein n=1 Tax=Psychrobacillus sp. L3 TaxID=3236891 RepID=UPI0036F37B2F
MTTLNIDYSKTALVLIDLQKGIVAAPGGNEVVQKAEKLVQVFRENEAFISFVKVDFHDGKDALHPALDIEAASKFAERAEDWAQFDSRLNVTEKDYVVTKRQWGAFFGTDLDIQLRRRGIDTIVLCGVATNIGEESTAREAFQHGYNQIFITDAMTSFSQEEHEMSLRFIFPRIGKLRTTDEFLEQVRS